MTNATIKVLNTQKPGPSLAVWLAYHHPDLFLATLNKARAAQAGTKTRLGRFADGTTTQYDDSGGIVTFDSSQSSIPDFVDVAPNLDTITVDQSSLTNLPDNLISDSAGSSALSAIANGSTSTGSSLGSVIGGGISGVLGALGSVASYVGSATGINTLTGMAKSIYGTQTANSVLQTQIARAATNQLAAPITYTANAAGQLVPVYTNGSPLTTQGLASLTPSSLSVFFSQYGVWVLVAGVAIIALSRR